MYQRIRLHARSCQLKLGVLTLPRGDSQANHLLQVGGLKCALEVLFRLKPATSQPPQGGLREGLEVLLEMKVVIFLHMIFDVVLDHLIRYVSRATGEISPCPHPLTPVLLPQRCKLPLQLVGRLSLQFLDQLTHRHLRRRVQTELWARPRRLK